MDGNDEKKGKEEKKEKTEFFSQFLLSDDEMNQRGIDKIEHCLYQRKNYQESFGISTWYDKEMEEYTFKTEIMKLEFKEGVNLVNLHRNTTWIHLAEEIGEKKKYKVDKKCVEKFKMKLKEKMQTFKEGCFVKLDTRSPKDLPFILYDDKDVQSIVDKHFSEIRDKTDINEVYLAFFKAMNKTLHFKNVDRLMEYLVRSTRIYEDLYKQTKFGEKNFRSKIIFREWDEDLFENMQFEFRCFVHKNKLNAVSQYFCDTKFDALIKNKSKIEEKIVNFFRLIKTRIRHESYVIDLYVNVFNYRIKIIEINPFHVHCGACLFSWEKDRELFLNGPLEFRFVEEDSSREVVEDLMIGEWQKYVLLKHGIDVKKLGDKQTNTEKTTSENKSCVLM